ncbi:HK97 family phage prohead protease [Xenorhabdus bovienii]|uniref:HK97 family phage prohead protease n=2 Tax=Xenorhabdus bovienii TaxID=40576 RepID=UPI00237D227D|nr:HK97 family phage prohead protease [Xenorhabdus bovienii]MDE1494576.1 HK97 family phage prohead protease [Xenorhabdus bovienii]MDE9474671.1 HK97 family phage prohead protease [Xenorhabdus bovienii]MDE9494892.1 HK97 family phage prohead protease [Xenorhabdus bovienii]MDE9503228.1 HK97 family phage prohead protease [Xenorhabdus bovienii]MDE9527096.1 HK97 family phage prohead protease [Xenorhabdus bovienii]
MNNDFEIRTASLSASEKKLTGYVVKWNSRSHVLWDEFVEQFTPNAFTNSLTNNTDVRALYEHDHMNLLGRTTSGTLKLTEDATGLRFELTPPDTQLGRDVLTLVERGDISGMSFGFRAIKDQWDVGQEPYIRTVLEAELREITITSLPAYPESGVEIARRSLNAVKPNHADLRHYWLQLSEV